MLIRQCVGLFPTYTSTQSVVAVPCTSGMNAIPSFCNPDARIAPWYAGERLQTQTVSPSCLVGSFESTRTVTPSELDPLEVALRSELPIHYQ